MLRFLTIITAITIVARPTVADTFYLRSGGQVQGNLLNADEQPRTTYQIRLRAGGDLTLDAAEVSRVVKLTPSQTEYRELLEKLPDTVESHLTMAAQCSKLSLPRERTFHLEQVLRLDPNNEQARRALKYKRTRDGGWARLEDIQEAAGLVKYDGRWVTRDEAELQEAAEQRREAKLAWQKDLRMWRGWLNDRRRRDQAIEAISNIDDPLAADALVKMFWEDSSYAVRELIAEVLGRLNSATATRALAQAAMRGSTDEENELRLYCVRQLEKNHLRSVVPSFVGELNSPVNANVRRAAYVLGILGDETVVLPLIKALRTRHTRLVGGRGNGGINAGRGGLSVGRTPPKKVDVFRKNKEVLDALIKLTKTGEPFGYDENRWLNWYLEQNTPPKLDLRRDP